MVDVSYQMVLSTLQTVGLLVGIVYYLTIMRNSLEARKSEVLWSLLQIRREEESMHKFSIAMSLEWNDYEDFLDKYGRESNPETWAKIWSYLVMFDDIGLMVNRGVIDIKDYYELASGSIPTLWNKYEPIILEIRKRGDPKTMDWLEYLIDELHKEAKRRGETITEYR